MSQAALKATKGKGLGIHRTLPLIASGSQRMDNTKPKWGDHVTEVSKTRERKISAIDRDIKTKSIRECSELLSVDCTFGVKTWALSLLGQSES